MTSLWGVHQEVITGGHPTGMSYLFYYTEQNIKTKGGKITNTRDFGQMPCRSSFTSTSLGKLRGCLWAFFGLAVANQTAQGFCHGLFK